MAFMIVACERTIETPEDFEIGKLRTHVGRDGITADARCDSIEGHLARKRIFVD